LSEVCKLPCIVQTLLSEALNYILENSLYFIEVRTFLFSSLPEARSLGFLRELTSYQRSPRLWHVISACRNIFNFCLFA
jgi:hypothetical protein